MALLFNLGGGELRVLVLTPTPQMHCENCENKIKNNMRFEKGVKKVETSIEKQQVTITYDPSKNTVEGLQSGMKKIGYETQVVSDNKINNKKKDRK
ncbi:MAG: heavy-metal-associated domain-containing protein [Bacteroidales bacterium]|nr:heavy-metal-associated domain-containing protein [Bacteroidales bacterium]